MMTTMLKRHNSRTACDRCYKLKERCDRSAGGVSCTRCDRLTFVCSINRPIRAAGRRPKNWGRVLPGDTSSDSITSSMVTQQNLPIDEWVTDGLKIDLQEKELLRALLSQPKNFGHHLVSSSFEEAEHRLLAALLPRAMPFLKDAYLAYAGTLQLTQQDTASDVIRMNDSYRYASSAIGMLRLLHATNAQESTVCLTLGTVLVLSVYSLSGLGVAEICQHCLSTTAAFTDAAILWDEDTVSQYSFLVLLDTADCLVHCRKPTQRFPSEETKVVSRHLGVCLSLLPYYYDLCLIGHCMANSFDTVCLVQLHKKLDEIRTAVEGWRPPPLCNVSQRYETVDLVNLLAQAKVYRLAALLVGHRLRYPFGREDGQARIWSNEIMLELELANWATKQPCRCVTLPYLVAAVEIQDVGSRVQALENVDKYVDHFMPTVQRAAKQFLSRIWLERDNNATRYWFQSLSKPCPVLQSLEL
ncbi:hypothetical protein BBK36DRAFT_1172944 [Trichoderma citrinoviride]|uniref:Zn(2)-C6 fungal-type domain-containing protein n=1 Tax=Trichoderma citrinoviride TaxID=58853 RepID=A0A2T4AYG3_9HYPO|nr:hypothetical protein BBK36DRAFT_1172944 [Trichoderma citrinoviride]PTB62107.1 hypothetical protein BBK36DRAFT_1172944 [Trichoderma citrinoviride]